MLATALQGALPDWVSSGLASSFDSSNDSTNGNDGSPASSSAMRDFFWESVGRGVLGLPGGITEVIDLLDPLMPDAEKTETAADEEDGNDNENDGAPAEGEEGSKKKQAENPEATDERRQAFLRQRDEDEVALYVPATAFMGPDWLAKAEAAATKPKSNQTPKNAGQAKSEQQNSGRNADHSEATENAADSQQDSESDDAGE
jgi:hypothetical protein